MRKARKKVLAALKSAKGLAEEEKFEDALSALAKVRSLDPTGAVLAVEMSQIALGAEDKDKAVRWAREVLALPASAPAATKAAEQVLTRAGAAPEEKPEAKVPKPKSGPYESAVAACKAIVKAIGKGTGLDKVEYLGEISGATCERELPLEFKAKGFVQAWPLRVILKGKDGSRVFGWVAIQTSKKEVTLHGPIDDVFAPSGFGLVNDYAIALEKTNVLPGGAPEMVVRLTERFTVADVALNEVANLDQTRAIILTLDRDGVVESEGFVLRRTQTRAALNVEDSELPAGWKSSTKLGTPQGFVMKVQWAIPNGIVLTKASGDVKPPFKGKLTLFPEAEETKE